jgi:hypothetical protein
MHATVPPTPPAPPAAAFPPVKRRELKSWRSKMRRELVKREKAWQAKRKKEAGEPS